MEQKKDPSKDYRKKSTQFLLIGLVVALSTTLLAFEWRTPEYKVIALPDPVTIDVIEIEPPIRIFSKKAPPVLKPPKAIVPPAPLPDPVLTPFQEPTPNPKPMTRDSAEAPTFGIEPLVPESVIPVKWAERMPEFKGGEVELRNYLANNLKYPKMALDMNEEAKLYIQFVVNTDGTICEVEVLRSEGFGFDKEAKRVIEGMPKWIPGKQGGKNVRVLYVIPINFSLL